MLRDLFINSSILISFIFIYSQILFKASSLMLSNTKKKMLAGVLGGILGITLMLFSIQVGHTVILDLRHLPVILLSTYLGTLPSFLAAIMIIIFRLLYFGLTKAAFLAAISLLLTAIGCGIIQCYSSTTWKRFFFMNVLGLASTSVALAFLLSIDEKFFLILTNYWFVGIITGFISYCLSNYLSIFYSLYKKLKEESTVDFLTGLNNVRKFDTALNGFLERVDKYKEKLSILMIDIDFFKKINDIYGHPAGDAVLQQLGKILSENSRTFDVVSRIGGEEFSVLLPDCPHFQALEVAERIRKAVESHVFLLPDGTQIHITVSLGASTYPDTVEKTEYLISRADEGLYAAKRSGRNKVCSIS